MLYCASRSDCWRLEREAARAWRAALVLVVAVVVLGLANLASSSDAARSAVSWFSYDGGANVALDNGPSARSGTVSSPDAGNEAVATGLMPSGPVRDSSALAEGFVAPTSALDDAVPNTNPFDGPVDQDVFVVDRHGTALDLSPGESLTSSPDGMWMQVRGPDGSPTGVRLDGPHNPNTHTDPRALVPHAHVPGVTNADGTPWLPRSWIQ